MRMFRKRADRHDNTTHADAMVIDLDRASGHKQLTIDVALRPTPNERDRIGEALCTLRRNDSGIDPMLAVIPIRRHPHRITQRQFAQIFLMADEVSLNSPDVTGTEIGDHQMVAAVEAIATYATIDKTLLWEPRNPTLDLPLFAEAVENSLSELARRQPFGPWLQPQVITRRPTQTIRLPQVPQEERSDVELR